MAAFCVINNELQVFIDSQITKNQMTNRYFTNYTGVEVDMVRDTLLQLMGNVKKYIEKRAQDKPKCDIKMNESRVQSKDINVDLGKGSDAECRRTETEKLNPSSSSTTCGTQDEDAKTQETK